MLAVVFILSVGSHWGESYDVRSASISASYFLAIRVILGMSVFSTNFQFNLSTLKSSQTDLYSLVLISQ